MFAHCKYSHISCCCVSKVPFLLLFEKKPTLTKQFKENFAKFVGSSFVSSENTRDLQSFTYFICINRTIDLNL